MNVVLVMEIVTIKTKELLSITPSEVRAKCFSELKMLLGEFLRAAMLLGATMNYSVGYLGATMVPWEP